MSNITPEVIAGASDDDLFELLVNELERRLPNGRRPDDGFVGELRKLPPGLRAMAATYELDVSLSLDDLGWHFGNWHHMGLAQETAAGLDELGAAEMADIFRKAFRLARDYWSELGSEDWTKWYRTSALHKALHPLNLAAWAVWETKEQGLFRHWLDYARRFPERLVESGADAAP
jgi:hypothetical protein